MKSRLVMFAWLAMGFGCGADATVRRPDAAELERARAYVGSWQAVELGMWPPFLDITVADDIDVALWKSPDFTFTVHDVECGLTALEFLVEMRPIDSRLPASARGMPIWVKLRRSNNRDYLEVSQETGLVKGEGIEQSGLLKRRQ